MKISIEKIRNCNSIIQFLILIFICVLIVVQCIVFIVKQIYRNQNSGIQIVTKESKVEIKQSIKYDTLLRDTYVFSLESNAISINNNILLQRSAKSCEYSYRNKRIVNFFFVSAQSKKETRLFDKDILIESHKFINDNKNNGYLLDKNIYAVAEQDTNEDQRLTIDDTICLYISDYNGLNLKKIGNNVYRYQIINDNLILFSEVIENKEVFRAWDINTEKNEIIKTINEKPESKELNPTSMLYGLK